ncbi:MAG: prenyltransferase [Hungatella sp.]|nr:prenyltransferase [Hungatella sp.]
MKYESMTLKSAAGLAAPQTWAATLGPVLAAGAYSVNRQGNADVLLFYLTLCGALLMQSSVNTLNDYYDYKKGTDNRDNSKDPAEAVLVYQNLSPGAVLGLAAGFLGLAGVIGLYITLRCGPVPLAIGCFGGLVILFYSGGKLPISYLPVGELVSGIMMGGLLPMAVINVLTGALERPAFYQMAPLMMGVGLIMYTNNLSDIEKDRPAGRMTLSVCLGRKRAGSLYRFLLIVWTLSVGHMAFWHFRGGFCLYPLFLGFAGAKLIRQMRFSFVRGEERREAMSGITWLNLCTAVFYAVMMLADRAIG